MSTPLSINHVLVIDEIPLISVGLQEVFRNIRPSIRVDYSESAYSVLSAQKYADQLYNLVILGAGQDRTPQSLQHLVVDLRYRFPLCRIFIYTDQYLPELIDKMQDGLIHAFVHKHETADEILNAYTRLEHGETYVSSMFQTLYNTYRLHR